MLEFRLSCGICTSKWPKHPQQRSELPPWAPLSQCERSAEAPARPSRLPGGGGRGARCGRLACECQPGCCGPPRAGHGCGCLSCAGASAQLLLRLAWLRAASLISCPRLLLHSGRAGSASLETFFVAVKPSPSALRIGLSLISSRGKGTLTFWGLENKIFKPLSQK